MREWLLPWRWPAIVRERRAQRAEAQRTLARAGQDYLRWWER